MTCMYPQDLSQLIHHQHPAYQSPLLQYSSEFYRTTRRAQMAPSSGQKSSQNRHRGIIKASQHLQSHRNIQGHQQAQRRRTQVACARCRKRKIKCSGDPGNGSGCNNCQQSGEDVARTCFFNRVQSTEVAWLLGKNGPVSSQSTYSEYPPSQSQVSMPSEYPYQGGTNTSVSDLERQYAYDRSGQLALRHQPFPSQLTPSHFPLPCTGPMDGYGMPSATNSLPPLDVHLHIGNPPRYFKSTVPFCGPPNGRDVNTSVNGEYPFSFNIQPPSMQASGPLGDRQLPVPPPIRHNTDGSSQTPSYRSSLPLSMESAGYPTVRQVPPNLIEYGPLQRSNSTMISNYAGQNQFFMPPYPFSFVEQVPSPAPVSSSASSALSLASSTVSPSTSSSQTSITQHNPASSFALPSSTLSIDGTDDIERHNPSLNGYSFSTGPPRGSIYQHSSPDAHYSTLVSGHRYTPLDEGPSDPQYSALSAPVHSQDAIRRRSHKIGS